MRIAVLQADERIATYYWEAKGSGIWMDVGATRVVPWDLDLPSYLPRKARKRKEAMTIPRIVEREAKAQAEQNALQLTKERASKDALVAQHDKRCRELELEIIDDYDELAKAKSRYRGKRA